MSSIHLPYQKIPRWNIDRAAIALNCARMGLPVPKWAIPIWGTGNKEYDYSENNVDLDAVVAPSPAVDYLKFNGTTTYMKAEPSGFSKTISEATLVAVVATTVTDATDRIAVSLNELSAANTSPKLFFLDFESGYARTLIRTINGVNVNSLYIRRSAQNEYTDGKFHILVGVIKDSKLLLYIDGKEESDVGYGDPDNVLGLPYTLDRGFTLGCFFAGSASYSGFFSGNIKLAAFFPRGFTTTQVANITNNPFGMFEPIRSPTWIVPLGATTVAPTTSAPTTLAPTTAVPTTVPPTSLAPTSLAPTTLAPTTIAPTTLAPTSLAPTTLAPPTTIYQTTLGPTTKPPATTTAPTTAAPTSLPPTTLPSTTLAPTTLAPTTVAPTTLQPTTVGPTTIPSSTIAPTTLAPTTLGPTVPPTTNIPELICIKEFNSVITNEIPLRSLITKEIRSDGHLC